TLGIGVSIWVGIIFLVLSVIAGQAVLASLPDSVMKMLSLIVPALFGGIFAQFTLDAPKSGIFALAIAFIMTKIVSFIPGEPSFIVTLVSVFTTIAFTKRQSMKNMDNEEV